MGESNESERANGKKQHMDEKNYIKSRWNTLDIYICCLSRLKFHSIDIHFISCSWLKKPFNANHSTHHTSMIPATHTHTTLQPFRLLTLFVLNFNNPFARWHGVLMPPNKRYSPWSPLGLCDAFEFWIIYFENVAHERIFVSVCFARPTDRPTVRPLALTPNIYRCTSASCRLYLIESLRKIFIKP